MAGKRFHIKKPGIREYPGYLHAELRRYSEPETAETVALCMKGPNILNTVTVEDDLEYLVSKGAVERTEHDTYCDDCHSDGGVAYKYALVEK